MSAFAGVVISVALIVICGGAAIAVEVYWDDIVKFWRRR